MINNVQVPLCSQIVSPRLHSFVYLVNSPNIKPEKLMLPKVVVKPPIGMKFVCVVKDHTHGRTDDEIIILMMLLDNRLKYDGIFFMNALLIYSETEMEIYTKEKVTEH